MAKRRGRHRKHGGRTTPPGTRPPQRRAMPPAGAEPEVVRTMRRTIEAGLVATLEAASNLVEMGTPRPLDSLPGPFGAPPEERTDLGELLDSMVEAPFPPLRVMAAAMLPMLHDELLAQRVRRQISGLPRSTVPPWLDVLDRPDVVGTKIMIDPLGDGDNILIGMSWPGRRGAVAVVYIDHNMGTIVKDAFVVPDTLEATIAHFSTVDERAPSRMADIEPADARARITEAIDKGDHIIPPIETDSWPATRPLVEWWVSMLPEGGHGHAHREWTQVEFDEVIERFVSSSFARELTIDAHDVRTLTDSLVWFAAGTVPGDPLRWSPVVVEIALADWLPRKMRAPKEDLQHVPLVMSAFVRFAHHERGDDPDDTADTLEAIDRWTPDFLEAIEGPPVSPAQNAARLARLAAGLDPDDFDEFDDLDDYDDYDDYDDLDDLSDLDLPALLDLAERALIEEIGGADAVEQLDDLPLPDIEFDIATVPDDRRELVDDVRRRIDEVCDALLDVEFRTLCRHHLSEVMRADERLFERSARTDLIAAGIVWATVSLQRRAGSRDVIPNLPTQQELAATLDVKPSSMSQRAQSIRSTLEQAIDVSRTEPWHSARRRWWLSQLAELSRLRVELSGIVEDEAGDEDDDDTDS